jgi:spore germination cell wall hydrolase CwlJ-like protein
MALGPQDSFIWGGAGAQLTPDQIAAQRKVAEAMLARGMDYSPIASPWQGAARVAQALVGGMESRQADQASKANADADAKLLASLFNTSAPASPSISTAPATPSTSTPMGRTSIPAGADKIYSNDEPSPLDPPAGTDRDAAIRTVLAEAGNQDATGMNAVASVIRNRAVNGGFGGNTPSAVVTAPNQFEPWNTAAGRSRMAAIDPNSPQYAAAGHALDSAYMGNDPTNGATMFYGPKAQAALGRPVPSWDNGTGVDIGDHRFFGGAPQTTQVAQADPAALPANSQPTQGYSIPGQSPAPQAGAVPAGVNPRLVAAMASPYTSEGTKKILGLVLSSQMSAAQKAADPLRALQMQKLQSDMGKGPTSVEEYKFYLSNLPQGQQPMDYGTWSTAKARAGATMINNNVGTGETAFAKEAGKVQANRFNDLVAGGQQAKQMIADVNTLTDLGKNIGTGKTAQVKAVLGPYAEALGVPVKGLSDIQAYEAIVNRVAPTLRVKGSGAQSDFELKNFLKSLPSLGNTPEGNNIAASVLQGLQQNKVLAAEIGSKALNGEITRADADNQLRDLPDPMIPYREYQKTRGGAPAQGSARKTSSGVTWSIQ